MPSILVGMIGQVPSSSLPFMPASKGVCFLGSQVSVCATPPGSQMKMTESALGRRLLPERLFSSPSLFFRIRVDSYHFS